MVVLCQWDSCFIPWTQGGEIDYVHGFCVALQEQLQDPFCLIVCLFDYLFIWCLFIYTYPYFLIIMYLFTGSFIYFLTYVHSYVFIYSLAYLLIHSAIHSFGKFWG